MGDALMAMFWAGIATGVAVGLGLGGVIVAVGWFWPRHHELADEDEDEFRPVVDGIGPDDEFRVVADESATAIRWNDDGSLEGVRIANPLPGWDTAAAVDGWHALENRRRNTDA